MAVLVVIVLIAAVAAIYFYTSTAVTSSSTSSSISSQTSSTPTSVSSSSSTSSVPSSTSASSTSGSSSTGGAVDTLTIDDETWPTGNLNQLNAIGAIPYPNWLSYTVYQSLVTVNGSTLYKNGTIQIEPMLAKSWNASASGTTWSFYLQPNVNFSNGDPLNAYQVWGEMYGFYYLSGNFSGWAVGYNVFNMSTADFGPGTDRADDTERVGQPEHPADEGDVEQFLAHLRQGTI